MKRLAIIGGSGLDHLAALCDTQPRHTTTRYGPPSAPIIEGHINAAPVFFLARHGEGHHLAPHNVNYRANITALRDLDATQVIAVNAVGGITPEAKPGTIVVPDQIIDYTHARAHTFYDDTSEKLEHVEFTEPYTASLRAALLGAGEVLGTTIISRGTYACTQGPRLESAAEIERIARDGGTLVGMTGMPEAALAREAGLDYAAICLVVNWAAGRDAQRISMPAIKRELTRGMARIVDILTTAITELSA